MCLMCATQFAHETTRRTRARPTVGRTSSGDTLAQFSALHKARESQNLDLAADSDFENLCCRALGEISPPAAIPEELRQCVARRRVTHRWMRTGPAHRFVSKLGCAHQAQAR